MALLVAIPGLLAVYIAGLIVYRIRFHPLAKYPGPFAWAITQWPEALSNIRGSRHIDLNQAHEQYGDIVRISPNSLSFRTTGAVRDIYRNRTANLIKTGWTDASLAVNPNHNTHALNDRDLHARRRRLLQFGFSDHALKGLEPFVLDRVKAFCDYMGRLDDCGATSSADEYWSKPKDMATWANNLTLDVLGELCFGKSFGAMESGGNAISELLLSASKANLFLAFLPIREFLYTFLRQPWLMAMIGGKTMKQKIEFRNTMVPLLHARFALEEASKDKPDAQKRKDFMHFLINARSPETGERFTAQDLVGEAALLVGAGSDTSSTALSATFFYLTHNPVILSKLQGELHSAFKSVEEIKTGPKLSSLHYLRACIDEALRMTPPVPGILSRKILPGGATIDGHPLPAGTVVGVPIYSLHHHEAYFREPFRYMPERWLLGDCNDHVETFVSDPSASLSQGTVKRSSVEKQREAWIPFSVGTRNCVGKNLAMMELLVTIARIVYLYDIRNEPGSTKGEGGPGQGVGRGRTGEYQIRDYFVADREGPMIEFRRRL